jgi:hypothetical protein
MDHLIVDFVVLLALGRLAAFDFEDREDLNQSGAVRFNSRYTDSFPYLFAHGMGQLGGLFEEMNQVWQKTSHLQWISITRLSLENSQVRVAVREA